MKSEESDMGFDELERRWKKEKTLVKYLPPRHLLPASPQHPPPSLPPSLSTFALSKHSSAKVHPLPTSMSDTRLTEKSKTHKKQQLLLPPIHPAQEDDEPIDIQDVLNCIIYPRKYDVDGEVWIEEVSPTPATRLDVVNLQDHLDDLLEERQAKEFGICPIRRNIYNQLFDELIRQVTVNCAERGLMFMRVRDEIRMSLSTYQSLYESAISYGIRKAIGAEEKKSDAELSLESTEAEKTELNNQIVKLKQQLDDQQRSQRDQMTILEQRLTTENEKLKIANQQLKTQIKALVLPPTEGDGDT